MTSGIRLFYDNDMPSINKTKWIWIYDREKRLYSAIKDHKMPYETIKRLYKAIQDHTRSHNAILSRLMSHMDIQDHTRPHKATQDHTRPNKAIQGKHDNSIPWCATEAHFLFPCTFFVRFGTFLELDSTPRSRTRTRTTTKVLLGPLSVARGQKCLFCKP